MGVDRPNPARFVAGGEDEGAGDVQGAKRYLLVGLGRREGRWKGVVDGEQRWSAHGIDGEVAPVGIGREGGVYELREVEAERIVGSARAERVWNGGFTAASSSPACRCAAMVFWGSERGSSVGVRGMCCGGALGVEVRASWGSGALRCAGHDDGEVAAARMAGVAWRREGSSSAREGGRHGVWA
jgi:hypothetical protein